ncbi:General alpha-glucoside permease [Cercospora beticola]|uniref:General alpha-glucoside permease n=1 Tax=Cercospora beticola TaxID=122368 RepID=A0A2G5HHJ6_CERBT|nr:General alpha-glucoside permease [Cercospora beticola]PIA92034.1 General alpha-glucoside permease [Cercospora beticola]WPB05654.1 hypothetical protein RHO25_010308 [Cercospora beticola]
MSDSNEEPRRSNDRDFNEPGYTDSSPLIGHHAGEEDEAQDKKSEPLSILTLIALTCVNGGLQVFFSTTMANLAPYLQRLSLSKSASAAITISLPLSGSFVGPLSGAISDRLRTRFGRRRPMMFIAMLFSIAFLSLLAWTENLVPESNLSGRKAAAVLFTILLSIAVQPVQAGVRALMVDVAPAAEQSRASGTVLLTCLFIQERDSRRLSLDDEEGKGIGEFFGRLWRTVKELPPTIGQACKVQIASWTAWFPFLYYNTTYIGELVDVAEQTEGDQLAQAGSVASLCFAAVGFFFVLVLPVVLPYISRYFHGNRQTDHHDAESKPRDLVWLWLLTQPVLGLLLVLTLAAAYQWQGTVLIAVAGLPWAVTQWVPWAVIGYETSRLGLTGSRGGDESGDSQSGAILGVHNMAISLPQVLAGAIASAMYKIAESAGSQVPTAWVLASGGLAAFVASFLCRKML